MRVATSMAKVMSLLGAFLAISLLMGLIGAGLMLPIVGATGTAAREGVAFFEELPGDLERNPLAQQSRIVAADGSLLSTPAQENRIIVDLEDIAPVMQQAQVAIEDERFFEHGGLDMQALSRALVSNATSETTQGGSTLTQQFVKLSLKDQALSQDNTEALRAIEARSGIDGYVRKLRELKYAVTLEQRLSKEEILEGYLNLAYYGDRAYGVEAAARHYYNVKAKDLSLPQAATLAGVVRFPSATDPANSPKAAKTRRNIVLDKMYQQGYIEEDAWREAKDSKIQLDITDSQQSCINSSNPYFCDYVTEWLLQNEGLGETREARLDTLTTGGLTVDTTLDTELAGTIDKTTEDFTPHGNDFKLGSAAATVEPGTGHVLAFEQSSDYDLQESDDRLSKTSVNWSVNSRYGGSSGFQIGSVAKAFTIVTALAEGVPIETELKIRKAEKVDDQGNWLGNPDKNVTQRGSSHPALVFFPDDFQEGCTITEPVWTVRNAEDENFDRRISLRRATSVSVNSAFATLASQVGTCDIRDTMTKMGLVSADGDAYGADGRGVPATFVLGADEASPLTVAASYATIASGGVYCPPVPVTKVTDSEGNPVKLDMPECEQVIDPDVAAGAAELMGEVMTERGSGYQALLEDDRPAGAKTGTADNSTQTWFAGYTPQLATAAWIGYPNGRNYDGDLKDFTIGDRQVDGYLFGSKLAAPMWKTIMDKALEGMDVEEFDEPSDTIVEGERVKVPDLSGSTYEDAVTELGDDGLGAEEVRVQSSKPAGTVLYTSPGAGASVNGGTTVRVQVSNGAVAPEDGRPQP